MSALRLILIIRGCFAWPALSPTLFQSNESNMKISFLRLTLLPVVVRCKRKRVVVNEWQLAMRKDARFFSWIGPARVTNFKKFVVVIVVVLMMVVRTKQQLP